MKRAATGEPIVVVPVVVEPVEVKRPAAAVPVEVGHVQVAVGIAQKYALRLPEHHPLNTLRVE